MPQPKVRIKMREYAGVNGEDGKDWHGGEEHDASPEFARNLETRGLAYVMDPAQMPSAPTAVGFADPTVETRDPNIGPSAGLLHHAKRPALTTASLEGESEPELERPAIAPEPPALDTTKDAAIVPTEPGAKKGRR